MHRTNKDYEGQTGSGSETRCNCNFGGSNLDRVQRGTLESTVRTAHNATGRKISLAERSQPEWADDDNNVISAVKSQRKEVALQGLITRARLLF